MILKFKGQNRKQMRTTKIGRDSAEAYYRLFRKLQIFAASAQNGLGLSKFGWHSSLSWAGIERKVGTESEGNIPGWLALLPAGRLVGGLSIKA